MTKNTFFATIFFIFVVFIACWKQWAWVIWKVYRLRTKEQTFDLLSKYRFIEITGPSGKGKSWLLMHLFKQLEGVKFTNAPTPQNLYTLNKQTLETHLIGKWGAPNKWFYFLDDINTFQQWCQQEFREKGYSALTDYFSHAGKLGGTFIWTSNGAKTDSVFTTNKNKTWKVLGYTEFMDKSLLFVQANDSWYNILPTIIAIDNKEIKGFYDNHWNIPKARQKNWLEYLAEELQAEELKSILQVIEEGEKGLGKKDYDHNIYQKLLSYVKLREKEEEVHRKKTFEPKKIKKQLQRYGMSDQRITPRDIAKWDKEDKKKKFKDKKPKGEISIEDNDLDQINQDPNLEEEIILANDPSKTTTEKGKSKSERQN